MNCISFLTSIGLLVLALLFCGCGNAREKGLIGTWKASGVQTEWGKADITIKFDSNGVLTYHTELKEGDIRATAPGTFVTTEVGVTVMPKDGDVQNLLWKNGRLTNGPIVFERSF